ncbi:hypothetical protein R1flu_019935 [Riccia fluitans]|uniref:Uncharacterized protein n=1 Tax=Riccia fluitans TaxID=41844 RepID=A0ABD1ZKH8_9MARC
MGSGEPGIGVLREPSASQSGDSRAVLDVRIAPRGRGVNSFLLYRYGVLELINRNQGGKRCNLGAPVGRLASEKEQRGMQVPREDLGVAGTDALMEN